MIVPAPLFRHLPRHWLLLLPMLCALPVAEAGVYLCADDHGHMSIQDRPCGKGMRTKSYVPDSPARSRAPAVSPQPGRAAGRTVASATPRLERNKTVICNLLDTEKTEAEAQIAGRAAAAPGENPNDNLLKIERQRTRVGCDVD